VTRRAVVLFSGGLDSTTCLAIAKDAGFDPIALSFQYGQRHTVELDCARAIAEAADVEHIVATIDLAAFGGSALVDPMIEVPKHASDDDAIPVTYVPARNTVFLSFALALAEARGAHDIYIGVNAVDYSGYPDCRPEFIEAFQRVADLATREGVEGRRVTVHTPLMSLTKAQIVELGLSLGVDYAMTSTCYDPSIAGGACGECEACRLRAAGFAQAGVVDPTRYAAR
jgi:7-cyano-7-deazaguanine synthase